MMVVESEAWVTIPEPVDVGGDGEVEAVGENERHNGYKYEV